MDFKTNYELDCRLKGEPWPLYTKLCDGKVCIVCFDGEWMEQGDVFMES